jgi:uncharacterized iron-regulated protein
MVPVATCTDKSAADKSYADMADANYKSSNILAQLRLDKAV